MFVSYTIIFECDKIYIFIEKALQISEKNKSNHKILSHPTPNALKCDFFLLLKLIFFCFNRFNLAVRA